MKISHVLLAMVVIVPNVRAGDMHSSGQVPNEVVAEVNGVKLTVSDLDTKEVGGLLQARYQLYLSQRKALDQLVDDELLELEASHKAMSVDQLLAKDVYKTITDPTEDQLRVYYEGLDSDEPYDSVHDKVLDHIRQLRRDKARSAYLNSLRKDAGVRVLLAPPFVNVDTTDALIRGSREAPVMLVEFADYECPYCERVNPLLQKLQEEYGSKIAIIYKDFPLPMHKRAQKAAEAARCAGEQGKYWEYHDILYYSRELQIPDLKKHAAVIKLEQAKFDHCLDSGSQAEKVNKDFEEGKRLGLGGTPSFFANGHFFSGAVEYSTLVEMVDLQLQAQSMGEAMTMTRK